jgi:signal transduction histidine kinase
MLRDDMSRSRRPTVWLVDDSPLEAEVARRMLSARYAVKVFSGGGPLLECLAAGARPDALVLDWNMPDISGLELCAFVRATLDRSRLPILVLTGSEREEELVVALSAGANDFVSKPCTSAELNARIESLVERKNLSEQLELEAAFRERFIGILGHDLRQPLNTFVLGTRVLSMASLGDREARTVARLANAATRMQRMIDDMLDLTRSRLGGGLPIARHSLDLAQLCTQTVDELRGGHPLAEITLRTSGDTSGPFDGDRVMQMNTNLIGNAIEHGAPHAPVEVTIDGGDRDVCLRVENKGTPIPAPLLASLFDPFRRGRTNGSTGLGLGLFIVKQIVDGHDGSILVESDEASTRFMVSLPKSPRMHSEAP